MSYLHMTIEIDICGDKVMHSTRSYFSLNVYDIVTLNLLDALFWLHVVGNDFEIGVSTCEYSQIST